MEGWVFVQCGQIDLCRLVLSSIGIVHMQLQRLPKRVRKELDKGIRNCAWGSTASTRRIHLLNWNTLCRPKTNGGAEDMNMSLLAKLGWRVLKSGEETWCRLHREKYSFIDEGPVIFERKQKFSNIWQAIIWSSELL